MCVLQVSEVEDLLTVNPESVCVFLVRPCRQPLHPDPQDFELLVLEGSKTYKPHICPPTSLTLPDPMVFTPFRKSRLCCRVSAGMKVAVCSDDVAPPPGKRVPCSPVPRPSLIQPGSHASSHGVCHVGRPFGATGSSQLPRLE